MSDRECVALLQWALPRLHLRWPGFRKVRRQVCRRIGQRSRDLGIEDFIGYRRYLESHPDEWPTLEALCRVTITRFYRDRRTFQILEQEILPQLADRHRSSESPIRIWSAGCASGEEPYTIALIWALRLEQFARTVPLEILATDTDPVLLARAGRARFPASVLKDLPPDLRGSGFTERDGLYELRRNVAELVRFHRADVRSGPAAGRAYDTILCRNLAFTYFDGDLQAQVARSLRDGMVLDGYLVLGAHEKTPADVPGFKPIPGVRGIFTRQE